VLIGIVPEVSPKGDAVVFSATAGASTNLWRMRISPETGLLSGVPEQLTFLATEAGFGFQSPSAALSGDASVLFIAPFRGKAEIPFAEWQVVSDSSDSINSAAGWSPDGNLLYFMSERDGSHCLWAQRLDAAKRPQGQPFEVQPFHYPQVRSMGL
jgi:WD40-like Beta Propeller Repeat